jgi:hypothetical protein
MKSIQAESLFRLFLFRKELVQLEIKNPQEVQKELILLIEQLKEAEITPTETAFSILPSKDLIAIKKNIEELSEELTFKLDDQ